MDAGSKKNKSGSKPGAAPKGRFAPSPTGRLHLGSMLAAVGSFLNTRAAGGQWLLRIEDIDPPREQPGAARAQIRTLREFGMVPDAPVHYQSRSALLHDDAISRLRAVDRAFDCACSRSDLPASGVYPGTCRSGLAPGRRARSVRFRIPDAAVEFNDLNFGARREDLAESSGDFVIRRADGLIAYQLAVVVDDIAAGITEVVRGADLLDSSARQQALYCALGVPPPVWLHLPLVVDAAGRKLSKSSAADPVASNTPAHTLALILQALGHRPPAGTHTLSGLWRWALANWQIERIPQEPFELPSGALAASASTGRDQ
ncbi:MAG: tRNA glutamyl-Q(34) synthetase GluQRS [Wenzhouxiangellaceae bacterium]